MKSTTVFSLYLHSTVPRHFIADLLPYCVYVYVHVHVHVYAYVYEYMHMHMYVYIQTGFYVICLMGWS